MSPPSPLPHKPQHPAWLESERFAEDLEGFCSLLRPEVLWCLHFCAVDDGGIVFSKSVCAEGRLSGRPYTSDLVWWGFGRLGQGGSGEKGENSWDKLVKRDPIVWLQPLRMMGAGATGSRTPRNLAAGGPPGSLAKTNQGPVKASACP